MLVLEHEKLPIIIANIKIKVFVFIYFCFIFLKIYWKSDLLLWLTQVNRQFPLLRLPPPVPCTGKDGRCSVKLILPQPKYIFRSAAMHILSAKQLLII
jgi:hypothetical protein